VQPWTSFGLPWLFDVLCGMDWPQGDEDAVRRCAQAWTDAMIGLLDAAGHGNDAATRVGYSVQSVSADAFDDYWKKYVGGDQASDQSYLGQLAWHSEQLAHMLLTQSDELEYTKLMMNVQLIISEIQVVMAIAQAFFTEGTSLLELPLIIKIGQFVIAKLSWRFLLEVVQMVLPDIVAQWVMKADGHETGWDVGKTGTALVTGVVAGKLGELGQGLVGRLPWMAKGLTNTLDGRLAQFVTHMGEGAVNNGLIALGSSTVPSLYNYYTAKPDVRAQIDLGGGPIGWRNLGLQMLSGGAMSGLHHFTGLYKDLSGPVTQVQLPNGDAVHGGFTPDKPFALFNRDGYKYGTGTLGPDGTLTVDPLFGHGQHTVDLNHTPYYETTHDGTTTQYLGYDTKLAQWEQRPSDGTVSFTAADGSTVTVPKHGTVTYAPETDNVLRAEVPQGGGVIQTWEPAKHGDYAGPYELVGRSEQSKLPNGQSTVHYYDGQDRLLATKDGWTGKTDIVHPDELAKVFGDPPTAHGTGGPGGHAPAPAGPPDHMSVMPGKDNAAPPHRLDLRPGGLLDRAAQRLAEIRDVWGRDHLRQQIAKVHRDPAAVAELVQRVRGYLVVLGADDIVRAHLQKHYPDLYRQLAALNDSRQPWPGGHKQLLVSLPSGAANRPVEIRSALVPHEPGNEGRRGHLDLDRYDPAAIPIMHLTRSPDHAVAVDNAAVREAVKRAGPELQVRLARARNGTVTDLGRVVDDAVHAGVLSTEERRLLLDAQRHVPPDPDLLVNQLVDLHQNGQISTADALALAQSSDEAAAYHLLVDHLAHRALTPQQVTDLLDPQHVLADEVGRLIKGGLLTPAEGQRLLDLANDPAGLAAEAQALSQRGISPDEAATLHADALVPALDEFAAWHQVDPAGSTALELAFHLYDDPAKIMRAAVDRALRPLLGQAAVDRPEDYLAVLDALAPRFMHHPPGRLPDPLPDSGISVERWRDLTRDFGLRAKWGKVVEAVMASHQRPGQHPGGRHNDAETKMFALLAEAFAEHRPPPGTTIVVTADKVMCGGCRAAAQFLADRFGLDVVVTDPPMRRYDFEGGAFLHPDTGVPDELGAVQQIEQRPGVLNVVFHAERNGPVLPGRRIGDVWDLARLLPRSSIPDGVTQIRLLACDLANNPGFLREARRYYGVDVVASDKPVWIDLDGNVAAASEIVTGAGKLPRQPYDGQWWVQDADGLRPAQPHEIPYNGHAGDTPWHKMGGDAAHPPPPDFPTDRRYSIDELLRNLDIPSPGPAKLDAQVIQEKAAGLAEKERKFLANLQDPGKIAFFDYVHRRIAEQDAAIQADIREALAKVAKGLGVSGDMVGTEFSRKTAPSIDRKMTAGHLTPSGDPEADYQRLQAQLNDLQRYTVTYPHDRYVEGTLAALSVLAGDGYHLYAGPDRAPLPILDDAGDVTSGGRYLNFWAEGNRYLGYNMTLVDPHGNVFELQFHTPESYEVKQVRTHDTYEVSGDPRVDPLTRANTIMEMAGINVRDIGGVPVGVQRLGRPIDIRLERLFARMAQDDPVGYAHGYDELVRWSVVDSPEAALAYQDMAVGGVVHGPVTAIVDRIRKLNDAVAAYEKVIGELPNATRASLTEATAGVDDAMSRLRGLVGLGEERRAAAAQLQQRLRDAVALAEALPADQQPAWLDSARVAAAHDPVGMLARAIDAGHSMLDTAEAVRAAHAYADVLPLLKPDELVALSADLVGELGWEIPPGELDLQLVRRETGEYVLRVFSDEAYLRGIRDWVGHRGVTAPHSYDPRLPQPLTQEAVPGAFRWATGQWAARLPGPQPHVEVYPSHEREVPHAANVAEVWLHRRDGSVLGGAAVPHPASLAGSEPVHAAHPEVGPGGVPLHPTAHGGVLPADRSGYVLRQRDLRFINADQPGVPFDQEAVRRWANREMPLGMPPELWPEWQASLREALRADGIDPDLVDIRMKGSAAEFFSGARKSMPTEATLAADLRAERISQETHDVAVARLHEWFGDDPTGPRPTARPFDAMYRLGLDTERSDYDLNFSSDVMFHRAVERWRPGVYGHLVGPVGPAGSNHGYLAKSVVKDAFPHLYQWAHEWEQRLGRPMSYAVFLSRGPDVTTHRRGHAGVSVHYNDGTDWVIQRAKES
jgi:hypothetical protein